MKNNRLDITTVTCIGYKLSDLDRETDINDTAKTVLHISPLRKRHNKNTRVTEYLLQLHRRKTNILMNAIKLAGIFLW